MKANKTWSLFFLLLAVPLGEGCGTGPSHSRESISSNHSSNAGSNAPGNRGSVSSKNYNDPDNAFAIKIPGDWKVEREEKDEGYLTMIHPDQSRAANLWIMTIKAAPAKTTPADLKSRMLVESSQGYFQGWVNGLKEQARVEGTGDIYPTRFDTFDALRMDVTYYKGDADDPRKGYCLFLMGNTTTFFIALTSSQTRFSELEEIISTLRIEP